MPMGSNNPPGRCKALQKLPRISGALLIIPGILLIAVGVGYYVYAAWAGSELGRSERSDHSPGCCLPGEHRPRDGDHSTATLLTNTPPASVEQHSPSNTPPLLLSADTIASQQAYPGELISPYAWGDPLEYEPPSSEFGEFDPVGSLQGSPAGSLTDPVRIIIPAIAVDSAVEDLEIRDLGNSRAYETPDQVVGHIPQGANPGEVGSSWYFGHLESPVAGEGNVFISLPKIPDMLRRGEEVYAVVESISGSYLYQLTEGLVVEADDLTLSYFDLQQANPEYSKLDPEGAILHLVTCVPRLVYDHRLVISGQLVGVNPS